MLQPQLLTRVIKFLNDSHIDYMVTGSIVSSLQGEPRATHDVDIVIDIRESSVLPLVTAFPPPDFYINEGSIKEAIMYKTMFNLLDTKEGDKIDFWILTDEPFDQSRFARKYEESVMNLVMKVSRPEDTILAKLKWANFSGGSEKQFTDALRIYEVQSGKLDLNYIQDWSGRLQVTGLWLEIKKHGKPLE